MPSQFETSLASNLDPMFSALGLLASYVAPNNPAAVTVGDDGAALRVRVQRGLSREVDRSVRATGEMQTATVCVQQSQLAKVAKGGRITVEGSEVWTVDATPTLANGEHICSCSRSGVERLMPMRAKE